MKVSHKIGFTLVELIVVMVVLGILAGVAIPSIDGMINTARVQKTREKLHALRDAIIGDKARGFLGYVDTVGVPPYTIENLYTRDGTLSEHKLFDSYSQSGWNGPYIETGRIVGINSSTDSYLREAEVDAWGKELRFSTNTGSRVITITSNGPDGKSGGGDDIQIKIKY